MRPPHTYLTNDEAAELLRISPRTLEKWRIEACGPRYYKAGPGLRARVIYKREDLEAFVEQFAYTAIAEYPRGDA